MAVYSTYAEWLSAARSRRRYRIGECKPTVGLPTLTISPHLGGVTVVTDRQSVWEYEGSYDRAPQFFLSTSETVQATAADLQVGDAPLASQAVLPAERIAEDFHDVITDP